MIQAVKTPLQRQQFLRAAQAHDFFRAVLGVRLNLYADAPATGWQFYTCERGKTAALAVRGGTAFACGAWMPDELGALLRFCGVEKILTPETQGPPADGFSPRQALWLYTLSAGERLPLPPKQERICLCTQPRLSDVTQLLFEHGPEADAFYAEACAAYNRGWAEYRLAMLRDVPVATVGATAIFGGEAYMAGGETAAEYRGKGIGGWLIVGMANELAARGLRVTFACEPELCRFYERLGFTPAGQILRWQG